MEIKGTVVQNLGVESGTSRSGKVWSKASVVVETPGQYPKRVLLTNFRDADEFAKLAAGTAGTFLVEVESREWKNPNTGRVSWFTEVSCWKWEVDANAAPQPQYQQPTDPYGAMGLQPRQQAMNPPQGDDLPF